MENDSQTEILKTLDRLKFFANRSTPLQAISPFYHAAQSLLRYADQQKDIKKKQNIFQQFYSEFEKFAMSDFSKLKKHHQKILDEIAEIIESQTFIECIRPDLHDIRHLRSNLKIQKSEIGTVDLEQSRQSWSGSKTSSAIKQSRFDYIDVIEEEKNENKSPLKQESLKGKMEQLYEQIKKSYADHYLDHAFSKTQQYLNLVPDITLIPPQRSNFLRNVSDQYEIMIDFYSQFDKPGWVLDRQQNGITLEYKIDEKQNMIQIRINGEGEIPIEPFLSIISEIDLMGDYVPFCYDCKQVKNISRNQRIGHSKIYIPLLKDRETYFYAAGYDRIHMTKSLFFFSKTINQDVFYQKKYNITIPPQDKYVRLEYKFFIVEYIPVSLKRAKIRLASKIDMKMNLIPNFILFRSARIFAFDYFKNIIDRIKNYEGSPWEKKVKDNPEMYKFFKKKLNQYLFK